MGFMPLILLALLIIATFLVFPPGRRQPMACHGSADQVRANSPPEKVSEKVFLAINGARQGMFLKGADAANPVLLFLSGGPGIPDYFLAKQIDTGLEDSFTVCYWDYRGTGLSYSADTKASDCTTGQFVRDALAVTDYLRERFGQEKIYLLGHSFGSYIGLLAAQAAPEKYFAYLAMSQIADQPRSELLAYRTMQAEYAARGNVKMLKELAPYETSAPTPAWLCRWFAAPVRDTAMHALGGGTMAAMRSVITGIFFPTLRCTDYTWSERIHIWRGKAFVQRTQVARDRCAFVAHSSVPALKLPVYFWAGRQDLTCCYAMQKEYYAAVTAPRKSFYTFAESAHSPLFEQPALAMQILRQDVLQGACALADKK